MLCRECFFVEESENRLAEQAHANGAGEADQKGKTQTQVTLLAYTVLIIQCSCCRNGRNKAHGYSKRQCRGDVDQLDNHTGKDAVQRQGSLAGKSGIYHAADQHG